MESVSAGWEHTCANSSTGEFYCWGGNAYGQGGEDASLSQTKPVEMPLLAEDVISAELGWRHSCVRTRSLRLDCWGANEHGQARDDFSGSDLFLAEDTPIDQLGPSPALLAAGSDQSCMITENNAVLCWGGGYRWYSGDGILHSMTAIEGLEGGVWNISAAATASVKLEDRVARNWFLGRA
jgi:alpha-tubulin suppressor-like RCC1 family protein